MTPSVKISGYLTQAKLADALRLIVGTQWVGGEQSIPGTRKRVDMAYKDGGSMVVVEYDGDEHYCNTMKIKTDREKDEAVRKLGWRMVRFPFWIQLTGETLAHYFGLAATIDQDFPQGFITTKWFPASFCELGVKRFQAELAALPTGVRQAVVQSLEDRIAEHGIDYVLPSALRSLSKC